VREQYSTGSAEYFAFADISSKAAPPPATPAVQSRALFGVPWEGGAPRQRKKRSDEKFTPRALRGLELSETVVPIGLDARRAEELGIPQRWIFLKTDAHGVFHTTYPAMRRMIKEKYGVSPCSRRVILGRKVDAAWDSGRGKLCRSTVSDVRCGAAMRALADRLGYPVSLLPRGDDRQELLSWSPSRDRRAPRAALSRF